MWSDLKDMLSFAAGISIFLGVIMVPAVGIVYALDRASCSAKSGVLGLSYDYGLLQGCFVEVNGEQLPLETYLERKVEQNVNVRVK